MDILWGDCPPGNPVNALQALVRTLRLAIGAANVATTDAGYAVSIATDDVDVVRFERLVADGCRHLQAGDAALASDVLREALGLCRDEPLVEFAYAEFATGERARLQELVLVAVEARAEADLALGRHGELVGELDALCEQHALRERLWELRMLALYRSGRQADALRVYGDARERLVEAFGLEPGPGLRELEARVLAQDPALDLPGAWRVGAARWQAGNLRQTLTSFVGREEDLARLVESVRSRRLVTLIGPGGVGKTRLAVEAAATLRAEVADGAWLVELGGSATPTTWRRRWPRPCRPTAWKGRQGRRWSWWWVTCGAGRWWWCWTTASSSPGRRRCWRTPWWASCPACGLSPLAASRWACPARSCFRCGGWGWTRPPPCSPTGPKPCGRGSWWTSRTGRSSRTCAAASTVSRWPWSWPPPGCAPCRSDSWPSCSTTASG